MEDEMEEKERGKRSIVINEGDEGMEEEEEEEQSKRSWPFCANESNQSLALQQQRKRAR
jgi:hypothetical protein